MPQMRSRREQVDAHKFITSRMNQALVLANPDSVERPLRRIGVSIFASVMVLALVFGGFAIATLFGKGNDKPEANHIIQVKGTSAIYVYTTADPNEEPTPENLKLWPVTNFTSALLLLKPYQGDPPVQTLKPSSLKDIPRGFMVGIDNVPAQPRPWRSSSRTRTGTPARCRARSAARTRTSSRSSSSRTWRSPRRGSATSSGCSRRSPRTPRRARSSSTCCGTTASTGSTTRACSTRWA
nr:hypothetical protein GCM10025732_00020 [Glycomyces mayteni]BFF27941.1 hypothetical protein GCM10025732_59060 [Glycomyces mayteni]